MIAVEYLDDLDKASSAEGLAALLAGQDAPFDRREWWDLLARQGGMMPLFALACDGTATALLPLCAQDGTIRPLANWYTFRWRPLVTPGADAAPLLCALARELPRHGWRASFSQVPGEDGSADLVAQALRAAGWRVHKGVHDVNHVLTLHGRSFAEYLASRPGPLRTTLKRRKGKVSCRLIDHFDEAAWRDYEAVYAASWKPREGAPAVLEAFARQEGAAGRLRLGVASVDGRAVAAQFWTVEGGTAFIHKLAHREDAKALSPGTVLSAALFERVIDQDGVAMVDFGTGDDPYKRDWMDDIRPRYRIDAWWPRSPRAWPHLALGMARRLAARARRG